MADVRTALLDHLRANDDTAKAALTSATADVDLAQARASAKDDPNSVEAAADVLGKLVADGESKEIIVDSAKALAQRAKRDASGNDVALLAGEVLWRVGGEPRLAEPYFRRVRRSAPASSAVLTFYRELFAGESDASQLMQVLVQARRASEDADERYALAEEMSQLAQQRLHSTDRAIEVWRSVLREKDADGRANDHLRRLYREANKWTALVELLKEEFDGIEATDATRTQRIDKLLEIAGLYRDELKLDAMALATLQRILDIDPGHKQSLEVLAETYANSNRWNDLLNIYGRILDRAKEQGDRDQQVELLRKIASIWVERLGNPQRALEPLKQVLELDPKDKEARTLLAKIHEQRRDWRALIALRREELADRSAEEALELRIDLARLSEDKLGDRREAIADWNAVLEHHGENAQALEALSRLYERENRWAELTEILHRRVAGAEAPSTAVALLSTLAQVYADRLRNPDAAISAWREVVRLVPGHDKATRSLRDAYVAESRWDELTELYRQQSRITVLVDVLQSAADRVQEVEERVALYRRVAALCRDELQQPERALKALERTLAIQPDNLQVARELLPIYKDQGNWARLMSTYEVLLAAANDSDAKLGVIGSLREVARDNLHSPALTFQWSARAYELAPDNQRLRDELDQAAEQSDAWDDLTRIYEARIGQDDVSQEEKLELLDKLAVIARDKLFKPDDAQRYFRRIIDLDPSSAAAMAALEQIYSSTRRWDDLAGVYRKRLEVTTEDAARLNTLRGLARLQEQHLADLDGAVESYRAILEIDDDDTAALDSLAAIHRNRGEWEPLAEALARKLELTKAGTVQVPVLFELSKLRATKLRDSDRAISGMLQLLDYDPMHKGAVEVLEQLSNDEPDTALPVMRGLLPYYRRVEDRVKEAEAMEVLLANESDPQRKREQLSQLAGIYGKMEDRKSDALRIYGELFEQDASDWDTRQVLAKLGAELEQMEHVADRYGTVLQALAELAQAAEAEGRPIDRAQANLRRDLLLELGAIYRDALGRKHEAEKVYQDVLEHDETHQGAYEALETLLRGREAPSELVALYRRRVDVIFNQREQKELLGRMIQISRDVLDNREMAVETAEELLDLIPDDLSTIEMLARMYDQSEELVDREKLEELVGRWAELVGDDARRLGLTVRRAQLRMQFLGDSFGAVDLLGAVLGEDPDHGPARELLEELLDIAEVQMQVVSLLEPIYERVGDHRGRIRVLHVRRSHAEMSGSLDEATSLLLQIARIEENELGDPATAFDAAREAYLMDPRRMDTLREVERLGNALRREPDLVEVWRAALGKDVAHDKTLRIDLYNRIAVLLDEKLKEPVGAREAYVELLALDPSDAELAHRTVAALCRLHLEAGDFIALVDTQTQLLRFTEEASRQVEIRLQIAKYQLAYLHDRVGAALTWSEVLDMEPSNRAALDALERLFEEEEEWRRLIEVLLHRVSVTPDARAQASLWKRIGDLRLDSLDLAQEAIGAYQSILDLKVGREDSVYALRRLVEIHRRLERWPDVEEALRRLTSLADRDAERVELVTETAEVVGKRLGRGSDALDLLKRVLDLAPKEGRARQGVGQYLEADETRERAIRILTPLYEAEQNWAALLELQELQARKQPSGRRRLQALLQVANTQEERLSDPDRAFAVLCEAFSEAGDQPELVEILERVERLGAAEERAEQLYDAYARTVDHILDSDLQQRVLASMGDVALTRLGRLDDARRVFERIRELSPDDAVAIEALENIYLRQSDHAKLAELLVGRAEREDDMRQRDDLLIRAADIHRAELDQPEEAIALYERLSPEGLDRPEVHSVIEPLYEVTGRYRELAGLLNRKLNKLTGTLLVSAHLRLGRLYGEQLSDTEQGIKHLSAALRLDPDHTVGNEELGRFLEDENMRGRVAEVLEPVFASVGDWARLVQIQEIKLDEASDEESRVKTLLRIATIYEEQLEDLDKAFDGYARVFKEQPSNSYVRDQLSRLSNVLARGEDYAQILTTYVEQDAAGEESDDVLAVVKDAAQLWAGSLRNYAKAYPLYRRLLDARSDNRQVFTSMEQALIAGEMWKELADSYWREVDASLDEDRQADLLSRLANVAIDALQDNDEAARAYQRILELRPENQTARVRLEHVLAEAERHQDLLDLLRDRLARTDGTEARAPVYLRIAQLQNGPLDDPEGAIDTIEGLLMESPHEADAVTELERLAEARVAHRERLFSILEPIYEATQNVQRQVAVAEWRLTVAEDPRTRHELYLKLARLLGSMDSGTEYAFRALARAVAEPGPEDVLYTLDDELDRIAKQLNTPGALSDALVAGAGAEALASDEDRRIKLLVWGGRLQLENGEAARAVEILNGALALRPEHERALELLDGAQSKLGFHEDLRATLERRVKVVTDDAVRVELFRRLGQLLEDVMANPSAAEGAWRGLLEIEPNDEEALRRLSSVYEASGSTQELVDVLERRIDSSVEPDERRNLRMQLASLFREGMKDRDREIETLRTLLSEAPSDDDAMATLARALVAEQRWGEAADVIQERAMVAPTDERKAALMLEAARAYAGPLEDSMGAIERYEQVLTLVPGQDGAVGDLVKLTRSADVSEQAALLVRPQLDDLGRWADVAEVLEARAELSQDPEEVSRALQELASTRYDKLNDTRGALDAAVRLISVTRAEELGGPLDTAIRLASELGDVAGHVERLAEWARDPDRDPESRVAIAVAGASAAADAMADPDKALEILVPLLDADMANAEVCARIEGFAAAKQDAGLAARALTEAVRFAVDTEEHAPTLVRLGGARLHMGELDLAVEAFRDALDVNAQHADAISGLEHVVGAYQQNGESPSVTALDALEAAYQSVENKEGQANIVRFRIHLADPVDQPPLLRALAELLEQGGGNPTEALETWGALLARDAQATTALERVEALAREHGLLPQAAESMLAAVQAAQADERPCTALALATGRILLHDIGNAAAAMEAVAAVLKDQPDHTEALALAVEAARAAGDAGKLHEALKRSASVQADPAQATKLWREAAEVAETMLAQPELAIEDLRQLVDTDESDAAGWQRLLGLLSSAQRFEELAEMLGRRAQIAVDDAERRELRYRLANLLADKLERVDDAIGVYNDMLGDQPDDLPAIKELEVLLRRLERWSDVRDVLERKQEAVEDGERLAVISQMARLSEDRLEDVTEAIELYQKILLEDPGHVAARTAVERLLTQEERWSDLVDVVDQQVEAARAAEDTERYREQASRLAGLLASKLDDSDRAQAILNELLEVDPEYVPAILSLADVYEARGDGGAMRLMLQRAAGFDPQGAAGAALQLRLAALTDDEAAKVEHLEAALQLDPASVAAAAKLLELSRKQQAWDRVTYLLELAASRAEDPERRRALQLERVDVLVQHMSDHDAALRVLAGIYESVQDDMEVNSRIADTLFRAERFDEAQGMYNWLIEVVTEKNKRDKRLGGYYSRMARIVLGQGKPDEATDLLEKAYRIDTTNVETLMTLGTLHEGAQRWQDALKIYRAMLLQNADQSGLMRRGDIYLRLSNVHMGLEERPKAQAMLRRGIEEDPEHPDLVEQLESLQN